MHLRINFGTTLYAFMRGLRRLLGVTVLLALTGATSAASAQSFSYPPQKSYDGYSGSFGPHFGPYQSFASAMQAVWDAYVPNNYGNGELIKDSWYRQAGWLDNNSACASKEEPTPWRPGDSVGVYSSFSNSGYCREAGFVMISYACPLGGILATDNQSCMCPSGTRYFGDSPQANKCVNVTQISTLQVAANPNDNGPSCPKQDQPSCGQPINPGSGNMWHTEVDYVSKGAESGLRLTRTYNSNTHGWDARTMRSFGTRWTQQYDLFIQPESAVASNGPSTCWRREDNGHVWCETPQPPSGTLPPAVSVVRPDGKKFVFSRSGATWFPADASIDDSLVATYNADYTSVLYYDYLSAPGDVRERYGPGGRQWSATARSGAIQRMTLSNGLTNDSSVGRNPADAPVCAHAQSGPKLPAGLTLCITDNWGRQINFEYDGKGRITKAFDPAGAQYSYEYDGPTGGCLVTDPANPACAANNLTRVTYPGGASRTYFYNEADHINAGTACPNILAIGNGFGHLQNSLTGIVDENGARALSWTYNCAGKATSSQRAGGVEKVQLAYGPYDSTGQATTTVTHFAGDANNPLTTTRAYNYKLLFGMAKSTGIDESCIECGGSSARTYDAKGNIASRTDWNGNKTCYAYDPDRNLEIARVEGLSAEAPCATALSAASLAPPTRRISTQWHAVYHLRTALAEPNRISTFTYDAAGNLLARTERASTDDSGSQGFAAPTTGTPRSWQATYNETGQTLTMIGPRTDVVDITRLSYDSQGNLANLSNALGQITTFTNYDANGRVGSITDPNGLQTDFVYNPRGWLTTISRGAEVVRYNYDDTGQLRALALADGATFNFTHDDAQRMTAIADLLGNRIDYTLDVRGNRIREQVRDGSGAMVRQTLRMYDALNRLQQTIGAEQ